MNEWRSEKSMPIYEYQREDGTVFEIKQSISEDALSTCPTTGQKVKKLISRTAFKLEGGGWYKDGYSSTGAKNSGAGESSKVEAQGVSKTETTTKTESSPPAKGGCGSGCGCH
jgi:putative FmdB family regulatory protein